MSDAQEQLIEFFKQSGANHSQAKMMSKQMIKRGGQLAEKRGWTETKAIEYLLKLFLEVRENSD